jgi:hypothetical protein
MNPLSDCIGQQAGTKTKGRNDKLHSEYKQLEQKKLHSEHKTRNKRNCNQNIKFMSNDRHIEFTVGIYCVGLLVDCLSFVSGGEFGSRKGLESEPRKELSPVCGKRGR